jgi:RHS repeat-associated protein
VSDHAGTVTQKSVFYPFGQLAASSGTMRDERFASLNERDSETTLDPTLFRMYHARLYRWLTPDPIAGSILNPQSLNRYAYVLNNPCNLTDPLGLCGQFPIGAPGSSGFVKTQYRPGKGGRPERGARRVRKDGTVVPGGHKGVDLSAHAGSPLFPVLEGTVSAVGYQGGGAGMYVKLDAGSGYTYTYMHLQAVFVSMGDVVESDTLIGYTGNTGNARNLPAGEEHLHLEIRGPGGLENPFTFLNSPCPKPLQKKQSPSSNVGGRGGSRPSWVPNPPAGGSSPVGFGSTVIDLPAPVRAPVTPIDIIDYGSGSGSSVEVTLTPIEYGPFPED